MHTQYTFYAGRKHSPELKSAGNNKGVVTKMKTKVECMYVRVVLLLTKFWAFIECTRNFLQDIFVYTAHYHVYKNVLVWLSWDPLA